jgi:predicted enzyme related to lactoylglutathione lyase
MEWRLELVQVQVQVSDVDQAKAFYVDRVASSPNTTTR